MAGLSQYRGSADLSRPAAFSSASALVVVVVAVALVVVALVVPPVVVAIVVVVVPGADAVARAGDLEFGLQARPDPADVAERDAVGGITSRRAA